MVDCAKKNNYSYELPSFSVCWARLREKTDIKNQAQLANIVGKTQAYISKMKKQNIFLPEWAYFVSLRYDVSIDWILTGNEPTQAKDVKSKTGYVISILNEIDDWLKNMTVREPQRAEWFSVSFQDAFPMFREWKKRKEKEEGRDNIDPQSNVA